MISPIDDLIQNGPWPVKALCVECGAEYPGMAITRSGLERLERNPIPHGTCAVCIAQDEARLAELLNQSPKEEVLPNIEDAREHYEKDHADPSDPFDGRRDLS